MDIFDSCKQSLQFNIGGQKKVFWLIVINALVRIYSVFFSHLWYMAAGLYAIGVASIFFIISPVVYASVLVALVFLGVLATRSSVLNKGYSYVLSCRYHFLYMGIFSLVAHWTIPYIYLSKSIAIIIQAVVLINPSYLVLSPVWIIGLLFFVDNVPSIKTFVISMISGARFVVYNYPIVFISYYIALTLVYGVMFVIHHLTERTVVAAFGMFSVVSLVSLAYCSFLATVYLHCVHENFDRYYAKTQITFFMVLRSAVSWILLILGSVFFVIPIGIFLLLPKKCGTESRAYFIWEYWYSCFIMKVILVPVSIAGQEHVPNEPAIIIANHQSSLDVPLIVHIIKGYPHVWLAHKALLKSIFLRYFLPQVAVLVDTDTPMTAMRSLLAIQKVVEKRSCHTIVFPEGGRYTDGSIHDFFAGYVILAKKMKKPVVPVYIHGLNKVFPPHSVLARYEPVHAVVGRAFVQNEDESDEAFNQRIYNWFVNQSQQMKV